MTYNYLLTHLLIISLSYSAQVFQTKRPLSYLKFFVFFRYASYIV